MVTESLDKTSFGVATTRPSSDLLRKCLVIDQQNNTSLGNARRLLRSDKAAGTVAVVDRTANIELAAEHIAMSLTLYSGRGPYSPTCILVNEFVLSDFSCELDKYVTATIKQESSDQTVNGNVYSHKTTYESTRKAQISSARGHYVKTIIDRSDHLSEPSLIDC